MPDATKRILTDETGQDIVSALETLCTLVDPNGTAVAAAEKINNMTISVSGIAAGSSPTASVSEVDGHKHIALSIPVELPVVSSQDNGKVMMVKNGAWGSDMMDNATSETAGLMSAEDKQKLDGIEEIEIYQEIESNSNSVSFSDGAEAPLEELVIDIEPKQDLHGYSRPWVGGAGKNKLSGIESGSYSSTGSKADNGTRLRCEDPISVTAGQSYTISAVKASGSGTLQVGFNVYSSIGTERIANISWQSLPYTFTIPTGGNFITCGFRLSDDSNISTSNVTNAQFELGSTATSYEPYANICPISGYDTVNTIVAEENFPLPSLRNGTLSNAGEISETAAYKDIRVSSSAKIPLKAGNYKLSAFGAEQGWVYTFNSSGNNGTLYNQTAASLPMTFTLANDGMINFIVKHTDDSALSKDNVHVFVTKEATVYPIAVSLATNGNQTAGTVYSGTVTLLADGSGEVKVDHAILTEQDFISIDSNVSTGGLHFTQLDNRGNPAAVAGICNMMGVDTTGAAWNSTIPVVQMATAGRIRVYGAFTTISEFKTQFAGLQIVYPLATPLTFTLNANQVQTLLGYNYIYTDGAKISLTYVKDTSGLMTTADKIKLNSYPTKLSQLTNDAGYLTSHQSLDSVAPKADPVFTGSISLGRKANTTIGTNSFAVGNTVEASGANSHAEGNETRAAYQDAHAEGWGSEASSQAAHAEGRQGRATAYATHAEGVQTTASGYAAHSQGLGTQATHKSQHTAGEYNVLDPSTNGAGARGTYAEIIGNGADANNRSNARALDWSGNERLMGDVYVGCNADSTGGTKLIKATDTMTGATSSAAGAAGLVPAPATTDVDKFLSGDGTYKSGGLPMVILSYGNSTWNDFITAYHNNVIVYCRASSNANPASGKQTRMAFMAYVNDSDNPTQVEFQYYRSMNPTNKSITQMSDQVFVYTLTSSGTWSVISREASIKSIVFDASSGLTGTYDKNTGTLTITAAT